MPQRPQAFAFDVLDTLVDTAPLGPVLLAAGLPAHGRELWLARTLCAGFALAASGSYRPFEEVARAALAGLLADQGKPRGELLASPGGVEQASVTPGARGVDGHTDAEVERLAAALRDLPPHPDVAPALALARAAGVPAVALTNLGSAAARELLGRAGVATLLEGIVTIDDVQQWKPRPEALPE